MTAKEKWEQIKAKSMFYSIYCGSTTYAGEKKMTTILKTLNTAIDACWELSGLYDCSELENQHKGQVAMEDFEDIASKLEEIRETLFCDSLNYNRIAEIAESQMDEIDRLEQELEKGRRGQQ